MKIIMLLMTCFLMQVNAYTYAQRISINKQNSNVHAVLEEIRRQAKYDFFYDMDLFASAKPVSLQVKNATIEETLHALFDGKPYNYSIDNKLVTIYAVLPAIPPKIVHNRVQQQQGRVFGKILDDSGQPLAGASIRVLNSSHSVRSAVDGTYTVTLEPGVYTVEVSYISYQSKRITDVEVKSGQTTSLSVLLKNTTNELDQVVVTGSLKKENTAALYARQKNEAGISNGISAEQIGALPDKNIGETLKRISGVSTNDNRRVVVRGIAERYNLAMMDGAVLPSTDVQIRDFEFDIVPVNLIDNVIVSKTSTPDMSFGFGGGLIQINTLAIPDHNFNNFSFGGKYVKGSTGKDFLGYGRGKYDYLGFDDGSRDHFPKDILVFNGGNYNPLDPYGVRMPGFDPITPEMIAEQNKRIGGLERMGTRVYKTAPGQNYQFSLGRNYTLKNGKFGFVGSLSYRNEQSIEDISHFARGNWEKIGNTVIDAETGEEINPTYANQYNFNTNWGGLLNVGWSSKNHKITSRNFYSRVFSNQFSRIVGWGNEIGYENGLPEIREYDRPKFIDLLQNRVNGEHTLGAFRVDWSLSRNKVSNLEQDAVEAWLAPTKTMNGVVYNVTPSGITNPGGGTFNRAQYRYDETNKAAELALSYNFLIKGLKQIAKTGYQYMDREGTYDWTLLPIGTVQPRGGVYPFVPVQEWTKYLEFNDPAKDLFYYPAGFSYNGYQGKNNNQAIYAMLDNRITEWIRLVWGARAEYYKYERIKNGVNDLATSDLIERAEKQRYVDPISGKIVSSFADPEYEEKTWRYLPSASLTVTPFEDFNIRAAYSQSVIRPALIENSRMIRFDPNISAYRSNEGVLSTLIDHYDVRVEWYPKSGEVISFGYFYKYFDKPAEIYRNQPDNTGRVYVVTRNSEWAKVSGWEFDMRKSLGFIKPEWLFLDNLYLNGNITIQNSKVQASTYVGQGMNEDKYGRNYVYRSKKAQSEKRPLYGQVPLLYNIGLQYDGDRFGTNIAFNHMGYKTFTTGLTPDIVEYERPRNQLDAQVSYNFLRSKKLKTKLNVSNLLNDPYRFYINSSDTYKLLDKWKNTPPSGINATEWSDVYEWKYGFSQGYEEGYYETSKDGKTKQRIGDKDTFTRRVGTSFSLSVSYSF
ncbi:MAG: TonB-dependent receptor [Sphingobacterium sp.]|nr:TonB-dependent receptor [Sphingobacterium sp.]